MAKTQTQCLFLRKSDKSDYKFFYELLKERDKIENISHRKMPSRKESDKFNASKPYTYDFVVLLGNVCRYRYLWKRIGRTYITKNNEIGIFIKKEFQGKHCGTKVINLLFNETKLKRYYANVSPLNKRSQKFFKKLGFKLIQYTYAV